MQLKATIRLLSISILLILFLAACGDTGTNTGAVVVATSAASTPTSAPAAQHFHVGQLVAVGNIWQITVVSVTTSQGDDFSKPKTGNVYLVITLKLKNISNAEQDISTFNFVLRDAQGQQYNDTFVSSLPTEPSGKVAAGAPLAGAIPYEVPIGAKKFTYSFQSDLFSGGQTIWDLSV
jgi:hypothetical protein